MTDLEWLDALAAEIGRRMDAGQLPPQDSSGRYLLDRAAADVAATVSERASK